MIIVDDTLISEEIFETYFVCDLNACKGACCVEGESGAPLDETEIEHLTLAYPAAKPYMTEQAIKSVEKNGVYVKEDDGDLVTPLVSHHGACAFVFYDENNIAKCALEKTYYEGKSTWKKPISCHLYPIIAKKGKHGDYERVNYEPREQMCSPACAMGEKLKEPVYQFLKEPLIRKYGEDFYNALDTIAKGEWE